MTAAIPDHRMKSNVFFERVTNRLVLLRQPFSTPSSPIPPPPDELKLDRTRHYYAMPEIKACSGITAIALESDNPYAPVATSTRGDGAVCWSVICAAVCLILIVAKFLKVPAYVANYGKCMVTDLLSAPLKSTLPSTVTHFH